MRGRSVFVILGVSVLIVAALGIGGLGAILWGASSTILMPPGPGDLGNLALCRDETRKVWGEDCGRLSQSATLDFGFQSPNGYALAGWIVTGNASEPADAVLLYVPGGGSDRREASRYLGLLQRLGVDLATFDPVCQGLSPCPVPGLSYGARESADIAAAVTVLGAQYRKVVVMGSSMGALSIIRALPELKPIVAAVLENPMISLDRLLRDARQSQDLPGSLVSLLVGLTQWRGQFPKVPEALEVLEHYDGPPLMFIHSHSDSIVPWTHSEELAAQAGSATTWFPSAGEHGAVWNADPAEYERHVVAFLEPLLASQD